MDFLEHPLFLTIIGSVVSSLLLIGGAWCLYVREVKDKTKHIRQLVKYIEKHEIGIVLLLLIYNRRQNLLTSCKEFLNRHILPRQRFKYEQRTLKDGSVERSVSDDSIEGIQHFDDSVFDIFYGANINKTDEMNDVFGNLLFQRYSGNEKRMEECYIKFKEKEIKEEDIGKCIKNYTSSKEGSISKIKRLLVSYYRKRIGEE